MSQTNTLGDASIGGSVDTGGGDFVNQNKIILILSLSQFLRQSQFEGILPMPDQSINLEGITEAVEETIRNRLGGEFVALSLNQPSPLISRLDSFQGISIVPPRHLVAPLEQ